MLTQQHQQHQQHQQQQQQTSAHILIMNQPQPHQNPLFQPQEERPTKKAKMLSSKAGFPQEKFPATVAIATTTASASASSSSTPARSRGGTVAGMPAHGLTSTSAFDAHAIQQHVLNVLLPQYLSVSLQNTPHSEDEKAAAQRRHKAALLKAMASAYAQPFVLGFLRTVFTGVWEEIEATARLAATKADSSSHKEDPNGFVSHGAATTAVSCNTSGRGRHERLRQGLRQRMQRQRWLIALRRVLVQIGATADSAEHTLMALTSAVLSHTMRLRVRHILQRHAATDHHRSLADVVVADPSSRLLDVCREVARHDIPILDRHCSRTCSPVVAESTSTGGSQKAAGAHGSADAQQQAYLRRSVLLDVYKALLGQEQSEGNRQQQQQQQQQDTGRQQQEQEQGGCEKKHCAFQQQQQSRGTHMVDEKMLQVAWRMERLFKPLLNSAAPLQKENDASSGGSEDAACKATAPSPSSFPSSCSSSPSTSASPIPTAVEETAKAAVTQLSMKDSVLCTAWRSLLQAAGACDVEVLKRVVQLDGKQQALMLATFAQRFYHTRRQHHQRYSRFQCALLKASPSSSPERSSW